MLRPHWWRSLKYRGGRNGKASPPTRRCVSLERNLCRTNRTDYRSLGSIGCSPHEMDSVGLQDVLFPAVSGCLIVPLLVVNASLHKDQVSRLQPLRVLGGFPPCFRREPFRVPVVRVAVVWRFNTLLRVSLPEAYLDDGTARRVLRFRSMHFPADRHCVDSHLFHPPCAAFLF